MPAMLPPYVCRCGLLAAAKLLYISILMACEILSPATPEQLMAVAGTVTSATNGRPLPGVLLAVESFARGFSRPITFTGYQRLGWNYGYLHGNTLDTTACLRNSYLPPAGLQGRYLSYPPAGAYVKDTAVAMVIQNPGSFLPDTVRATLTFLR
ncbi:hypothetical protein [Hymenobacter sp. H14-R3]|uniref:hypothetical protein n=1 Tax=Hymenobacter sp. H14-R3 TaxID=3046308 RepID=UPI0024B98047|nr:hypothetical protein [Hymenobacter sp. H14-R3]